MGRFSKNYDKKDVFSRLDSLPEHLKSDERYKKIKELADELLNEIFIPVSIFSTELSPLEAVSRYLHDNKKMSFSEIGRRLNKERTSIWLAYKNSKKKYPKDLPIRSKYNISLFELNNKLSVLESVVVSLKDNQDMNFSKISTLLDRAVTTIHTAYKRGKQKLR